MTKSFLYGQFRFILTKIAYKQKAAYNGTDFILLINPKFLAEIRLHISA